MMTDWKLSPLFESGALDRSVVIGAPDDFDFPAALKDAKAIRLAVAFGHISGWNEIEEPLRHSSASTIHILLGRAFFQTEPAVILALKARHDAAFGESTFRVKLASDMSTFHPKVWIVENDRSSFGIVGSGNLSRGGLLVNVECGLYTNHPPDIAALKHWFDLQWTAAPSFVRTYEEYIKNYQRIKELRKGVDAQIQAATAAQADREATWRRRQAIRLAAEYWKTTDGKGEVKSRNDAISAMRSHLNYPAFDFGVDQWRQFVRIPELGRIRLGHEQKTIAALAKLKEILQRMVKSTSLAVLEDLQTVPGIGRNLATKLLVVHRPDKFVVINDPVESALHGFGYELDMSNGVTRAAYDRFLKDLAPFIEEAEAANLHPAAALDAFFYDYRHKGLPDEY